MTDPPLPSAYPVPGSLAHHTNEAKATYKKARTPMPSRVSLLPRRPHRRLGVEWLLAVAGHPLPIPLDLDIREVCSLYLSHRFVTDAPSVPKLAIECRDWILANRPGVAATTRFPSGLWVEKYLLRSFLGAVGISYRDRVEAARIRSHELNRARLPELAINAWAKRKAAAAASSVIATSTTAPRRGHAAETLR